MAIKSARLKELIEKSGGMTEVAQKADVGISTLQKMTAGSYDHRVGPRVKRKLLTYFQIDEAEIFGSPSRTGRTKILA